MPFEQLVPSVFPDYRSGDIGWPNVQSGQALLGTAVSSTDGIRVIFRSGIGTTALDFYLRLPTGGAGFSLPDWSNSNGVVCMITQGTVFPSGYYFGETHTFLGPLQTGVLTTSVPPWARITIDDYYVRWANAAPTISAEDKPLIHLPTPGGGVTNIDTSGILGAQYGLRGTGATGVEWYVTVGGVLVETVAITWPETDWRNWVKVTTEHFAATPNEAAKFNLYLNDNLVIARDWEVASIMPRFTDAVGGNGIMMRRLFRQGVNAELMLVTMMRSRSGNFDINGVELL